MPHTPLCGSPSISITGEQSSWKQENQMWLVVITIIAWLFAMSRSPAGTASSE
ncbi:MAG: hypothetical protein H7A46_12940 [Verrucomicrobiales bacterium]|nr:hypothetical protein [Verrucomicrobiales bacterium]